MTPDQLRRYIADAERAIPAFAKPASAKLACAYRDDELAAMGSHHANTTPELFAALCRYALAGMACAAASDDDTGANPMHDYDAALRALEELP